MPSTDPPSLSPLPPPEVLARWRRAAESARDGLWEVRLGDGTVWFSDRFGAILGHGPGELPADLAHFSGRIHADDLARWRMAWDGAAAHGSPLLCELRVLTRDGEWRWVQMRGRCWLDDAGRPETIAGSLGDLHDEREFTDRLEAEMAERTARLSRALADAEQERAAARHAAQAQARFLAHMSHELRTPLGGLLGLVDLARRTARETPQKRYLEVAMQSGAALQRTIDQVLDLTHLRDGELPLSDEPFDIAEEAAEALRAVMPLVREKGLSVRYDWLGEPTWVYGDALRLRQIVGNLVGNAARFTERGHIALNGRMAASADDPGWTEVTIDVEDTGPGIAPDRLATAFDEFVQGDDSRTRVHGGAGLGLPIARALARRMGGEIAGTSSPGRGSVFTLRLRLPVAADPDPVPASGPGHAWLLYRQPAIAHWLQRRVERLGWSTEIVTDVAAAVSRAASLGPMDRPALVVAAEHVLDPDVDLQALRRALPRARVSLLIRPDWDRPVLEAQALSLDMQLDVMPLTPRDLRLLMRPEAQRAAVETPVAGVSARASGHHVLVVEDNAVNRLIAEEFLRTLGVSVRSVADGAEALRACDEQAPALVLMDLQMPVMDGLTASREICQRQREGALPAFPIVALTAHARAADAEACREAGMQGYLTKPLLLDALREELARWL